MPESNKPVVLITGARGNIGRSLAEVLRADYRVVGLDRTSDAASPHLVFACDFASEDSIRLALREVRDKVGSHLASVIHLVAYYDFTNEEHPLYQSVNVEGSAALLRALQSFQVEQFIYASTMLVHAPCRPGERIDESHPIAPRWAYPKSKATAEEAILQDRGAVPVVMLRLAGVYDRRSMVPTLAQQFASVYEKRFDSYLYPGDMNTGQAMLHREDMLDAFVKCVAARDSLPPTSAFLVGEADAIGYDALQDQLGRLMHGDTDWPTRRVPKTLAATGAWMQRAMEPLVPDAIDGGRAPFVRPFMVQMADDHYALDTGAAEKALGWKPAHRLRDELPGMVREMQDEPIAWYQRHGVAMPEWLDGAKDEHPAPHAMRREHEDRRRTEHGDNRWVHMMNVALGSWLFTQPLLINVEEPALRLGEMFLGALLMIFATASLSLRAQWARWGCAAIGIIVMALPFMFWTASAAAYLSDTLVGALIVGFAVGTKPEPGVSPIAASGGPLVPAGWTYNPSSWAQRLPIVLMALFGLYVSRYLAGYQLGHIPQVWDPFFDGSASDPRNGTEESDHVVSFEGLSRLGCRTRGLYLPAGDPHRSGGVRRPLAHHAVAGDPVRTDDCAAGNHLHRVHHHPADRDRHVEHRRAGRCGRHPDPDPILAGRDDRNHSVPQAPPPRGTQLGARSFSRRHGRRCQGACRSRRVRQASRRHPA